MTATLSGANASKDSASFLSYRKYCCCLCTRSGINDLVDFETSIFQEIREESEVSHLSLPNRFNDQYLTRSLHATAHLSLDYQEQMSYKLVIISGIIWLMQFIVYSMLSSFYPIESIYNHNTNIYPIILIIILQPLTSLIFTPISQTFPFIYRIGLSHCIVIGLILQGILCILFGFIPQFVNHTHTLMGISKPVKYYIFCALIRFLSGIVSVIIELSLLSLTTKVTPPKRLSGKQNMPLFCMIGLVIGPLLSGYIYAIGYKYVFITIGIIIIISAVIAFKYIPSHINSISKIKLSNYLYAYTDMNIIFSTIISIYSLICVTYVLNMLSLYLNDISPARFNIQSSTGKVHIATYYLAFGIPFIIFSFVANAVTYSYCGSLKTMLFGMLGTSIGLLFISRREFYEKNDQRLVPVVNGLVIMSISSAFCLTPYLLYLRNALFRKYGKETTNISFNIYRFIIFLGIIIGPLLCAFTYERHNNNTHTYLIFEETLFVLCIISCLLPLTGFILFKCLRWEWIKFEPNKPATPLIFSNSNLTKFKHNNNLNGNNEYNNNGYEIKYIPILQDDKAGCCCCTKTMCFFSFGALYDHRNEHYKELREQLRKKKQRQRDKNNNNNISDNISTRTRRLSRKSFDETETNGTTTNTKQERERDDIGQMITIRKKSSKIFDKTSFGGINSEHEYTGMYGNDGKTVTKDEMSELLLAKSWNTLAKKPLFPGDKGPILKSSDTKSESSSSQQNPREKSRRLDVNDINTPRGRTAKIVSKSQQKNSDKDVELDEKDSSERIERRRSQKITIQSNVNSIYNFPQTIYLDDDGGSDDDKKTPFIPTTPKFNTAYYQRMNSDQNNNKRQFVRNVNETVPSHSYSRPRLLSRPESVQSSTDAASQTFLLLSDDDFISKHDENDIYNDVPEESPVDAYFNV